MCVVACSVGVLVMAKRHVLVDLDKCPMPKKPKSQMNWDLCALCQLDINEVLLVCGLSLCTVGQSKEKVRERERDQQTTF